MMILALAALVAIQQPTSPPIRPLGPITHVSQAPLASVAQAVAATGGRVFVNDPVARRVLLYDSTLGAPRAVLDSTSGIASAYGDGPANLLPYQGDSVLVVSATTRTMLVLTPDGGIARTMALPPAAGGLTTPYGSSGFDGHGRLLYPMQVRAGVPMLKPGEPQSWVTQSPDSSFVVRFDLGPRRLDTVAVIRAQRHTTTMTRTSSGSMALAVTRYPFEVVDEWTLLPDGTLAIIRGRDYHVDWLGPQGQWSSTAKILFNWEHLDDAAKRFVIDSAVARIQFWNDSMTDAMEAKASAEAGGGSAGRGRGSAKPPRVTFTPADLKDVPDYRPAFSAGAVRSDAESNLWVVTTTPIDKGFVYDVIDRRGQLIDRVRMPPNRYVAGFGPGVVYMAVLDSNKVAHLERARVK